MKIIFIVLILILILIIRVLSLTYSPFAFLTPLVPAIVECITGCVLPGASRARHRVPLGWALLVIETGLKPVLGHSVLDDGSLRIVPPTTTVALIIGLVKCIIVQSFLNHANSLLLMAEGCKTAECHIVCPVESTEVLRVFHSIGPVGLRF